MAGRRARSIGIARGRALAGAVALAAVCAAPTAALAQPLPSSPPLPYARPLAGNAASGAIDALTSGVTPAQETQSEEADLVAEALGALEAGDVEAARAARDAAEPGSLDRQILTWAVAGSGHPDLSHDEMLAAIEELAGWPGLSTLHDAAERALARQDMAARAKAAALSNLGPRTVDGTVALARAWREIGDDQAARAALAPMWRTERLQPGEENAILDEFGPLLTREDHRIRMERMLLGERLASAGRIAPHAQAEELAKAYVAVSRNAGNAKTLLDAVPEAQRGALYLFATSRHLRRSGEFAKAAELMATAPTDAQDLVDPDAWWIERRVLSRELLDIGDAQGAYETASAHSAQSAEMVADAEFHAGWYALRSLNDAETAARHFQRIADIAEGPISRARGQYWLGRAREAGAPGDANAAFEAAARHGTAFYGQLAAARLGRETLDISVQAQDESARLAFGSRPAVRAVERLATLGHTSLANRLMRDVAEEISDPRELALLTAMAAREGNHFLALRLAKQVAGRGIEVGGLTHPTGAIPSEARLSGAGRALAYAIARQESEFNVAARSGAGALGLLQLLPGTARDMARKTGLTYAAGRLTSDAAYNATLGTAYLDEQLSRFAGSYVLTFIGYNAGPARAQEWIERYGDPRGLPVDEVVDWIERIPYHETRGYVQRVMENYQVYKAQLTGRMDIATDLVDGR